MIILNSFTSANDNNFGAQMTERPSRRHLFSSYGEISSKEVVNSFCI